MTSTYCTSVAVLAVSLTVCLPRLGGAQTAQFKVIAELEVGRAPHQINFSSDGKTAYIAAAGSDHVAIVDVETLRVTGHVPAGKTPLGVVSQSVGTLIVSRFSGSTLGRLSGSGEVLAELHVGGGPSLLVGPLPDEKYLVSVEKENVLRVVDAPSLSVVRSYPVGTRPFPASSTGDGRLAFVPNYGDGTVTVVDLWNDRIRDVVPVGAKPSGGVVLPGELDYAVAIRGEDKVVLVNTASFDVVGSIDEGIGDGPFSVVTDGRFAFVNNTASDDVSVIDLDTTRVIQRVPVGAVPIAMSVHPSGEALWVASEGSHTVSIVGIPPALATTTAELRDEAAEKIEVAVLGMIHGRHRESSSWGLAQVRETIRRFAPDVVCVEIPPNRWETARDSFARVGAIEESRAVRFPEYTDVLLPLSKEMDFEIVPCAGWTQEMSDLRRTRIATFDNDASSVETRREYDAKITEVRARRPGVETMEDPRFIHSVGYDEVMREELEIYDEYLNDRIGPGGWTNINKAHYALVDQTIRNNPGKRILVTFGGGHKYWLLGELRKRDDIELLDIGPFLPGDSMTLEPLSSDDLDSRCREEVFELHQFFEDWFGGVIPRQGGLDRFTNTLASDFEIVSPAGQKNSRDQIVASLESAHGVHRDRGVRIWIKNFRSRDLGEGATLATYEEWQRIAGNTRARLSTVVFTRAPGTPNGVQWRHVHETWLPE